MIETPYGFFPDNYHLDVLEDLCVKKIGVQTGPFGSQLHNSDYVSVGTPILTVEHLGENRILHKNLPRVTEEDRQRLSRYSIKKGDIIFSRVGSVDRRALVRDAEDGWLFSGRCLRVRPDPEKLDSIFLSYLMGLPSFQEYVRKIAVGATMPSINTEILSGIPVCYPPLPTQHTIARILGSLDDKIELNRQMNETLEAMAREIFQSWFVDFDPVRAKAEGRQPAGMDAETAALFPSEFEEVDGREVPRGWGVKPLSGIIDLIGGGTPKTTVEEYWDGEIPWFSVVDAPLESDMFVIDTEKHITQAGIENSSANLLPVGTTIITARGTVGKLALVGIPMAMNQSCYGIIGADGYPDYYIHFLLKRAINELQQQTHGTVFETITRQTFDGVEIVAPPSCVAQKFDTIIHPHLEKIRSNLVESRTLAKIRDALLPKLMSGEIKVPTS